MVQIQLDIYFRLKRGFVNEINTFLRLIICVLCERELTGELISPYPVWVWLLGIFKTSIFVFVFFFQTAFCTCVMGNHRGYFEVKKWLRILVLKLSGIHIYFEILNTFQIGSYNSKIKFFLRFICCKNIFSGSLITPPLKSSK